MANQQYSNRLQKHPIITMALIWVFILLLAELSIRVYIRFSPDQVPILSIYNMSNEKVHHDFIPSVRSIIKPSQNENFKPVNMVINSMAIRGPELKTKSLYRVINIGDSFIEAREVNFEDTFGERLNVYFENTMEFISHGIGSWAPTTEFSWMYHKGIGLKPDEVNLFLCINDFFRSDVYSRTDESYRNDAIYHDTIPVGYKFSYVSPPSQLHQFIPFRHRSKLYVFITKRIMTLPFVKKPVIEEMILLSKNEKEWPQDLKQNVDSTIDVVFNLNDFLHSENIRLNVLMVPLGAAWESEIIHEKRDGSAGSTAIVISQDGIEQYIHEKIEAQGIKYLELRESFSAHKKKNPNDLLFNGGIGGHWSSKGHEIVFDVLHEEYKKFPRDEKIVNR